MQAICLHNKDEIEAFLRQDPFLHLYELGDLDDFFWHHTTWYALKDCESIQQLVLFTQVSPLLVQGSQESKSDGEIAALNSTFATQTILRTPQ